MTTAVADVKRALRVGGRADRRLPAPAVRRRSRPGDVQTCDRTMQRAGRSIRAAAGHMHLLGRSIKIEVDPGTPQARTVLDIPVWDFDNQGSPGR